MLYNYCVQYIIQALFFLPKALIGALKFLLILFLFLPLNFDQKSGIKNKKKCIYLKINL